MDKVSLIVLVFSALLVTLTQVQGQQTICDILSPCMNGGTCVPTGSTYECRCPMGYVDRKCDRSMQGSVCSFVRCNGYCTAAYYQFREFICMPFYRLESSVGSYTSPFNQNYGKNCPVPSPCQNGGQCYTYWTNAQTQLYGCICEKGFSGVNCDRKYSFGMQPMSTQAWPKQIYSSYQSLDMLNKNFILLNSEIKEDMIINMVEYSVARAGTFKLSVKTNKENVQYS